MEGYKQLIKKRIFYYRILMLIAFVLLIFVVLWGNRQTSSHLSSFTYGMQFGLIIGFMTGVIIQSRKYYKALKDNIQLKNMYIEETDERYKAINMKVNSVTYYIMLYGSICACTVASFFNAYVSVTLIGVTATLLTLRGAVGIYYRHKY